MWYTDSHLKVQYLIRVICVVLEKRVLVFQLSHYNHLFY
jgi:hypothetical protein